ncbi:MAG: right-handed parallel beta-helix repeat-containing protein [Candidatus Zixiibacteriota bacterium]
MKGIACLVILALWSGVCLGMTIYVPSEQPTIQAGINAASDFDTVLVADGVYTGDGNRDILFYGKSVKLISENGPENCIIDCEATAEDPHRGVYFTYDETLEALLEGFTVKHAVFFDGGGICCYHSSPTIRKCIVEGNSGVGFRCFGDSNPLVDSVLFIGNSTWGMFISGSAPTLLDCTFQDNHGGIWTLDSSPITLIRCRFINNSAPYGGAIQADYWVSIVMTDCLFEGNTAAGYAAINVEFGDSMAMTRCTFRGCEPRVMWLADCQVTATDCLFEYNICNPKKPLIEFSAECDEPSFMRCVFRDNVGEAMWFTHNSPPTLDSCVFINNTANWEIIFSDQDSPAIIRNCTFAMNQILDGIGSVIYHDDSPLIISNTVIAHTSNVPPIESIVVPTLTCCNFYGNGGGDWVYNYADQLGINGNISSDPLFCDVDIGNCHLYEASPCLPENNECNELIGALGAGCLTYVCGDTDASDAVDIDDAVYSIAYIFSGGPPPDPIESGDADCSDAIDIDDVVYLITYIFAGGDEPCAACL